MGRGLASGDFNNDGAVDCLVINIDDRARLLKNISSNRGHWLVVNTVLPELGGREAYGAEITIFASGESWWRLLQPGFSYLASNDPRIHFGLGKTDEIESIQVLWPDGTEERFPGGPADKFVTLEKGSGSLPDSNDHPRL